MIYNIVALHDRAANAYARPYYVQALGQAIRSFLDELNRNAPENPMWSHPDDFNLFHLGFYDEDSGRFENLPQPFKIADGKSLKERNHVS